MKRNKAFEANLPWTYEWFDNLLQSPLFDNEVPLFKMTETLPPYVLVFEMNGQFVHFIWDTREIIDITEPIEGKRTYLAKDSHLPLIINKSLTDKALQCLNLM